MSGPSMGGLPVLFVPSKRAKISQVDYPEFLSTGRSTRSVMDEQHSHIHMENIRLRRKIEDLTQTVNDLQREIAFLRTELGVIRERIRVSDSSEHEKAISHPFLDEIRSNCQLTDAQIRRRRWCPTSIALAFVFHATSAKAYHFHQQLMPLPAKSLLEQKFRTLIHLDKSRFIDQCGIQPIVDQ
jgi:hypothetical protein